MKTLRLLTGMALFLFALPAFAVDYPAPKEGEWIAHDFKFHTGETLAELKLHYTILGTPHKNAAGEIDNGVVLLHGTSGSGKNWLLPTLADELYAKGQPLDASETFIIIPDSIGVGASSKPSDGLKGKFPHYRYHDIVEAEHRVGEH